MSRRTRQELRLHLFDHFSELLGESAPQYAGMYGCPLCLRGFTRSSAELQPGETMPVLTLEDVIPKGLGKRWLVLTCQNCNNDLGGRALDSHLHYQVKFFQFLSGDGVTKLNASMSVGEHRMAIKYGRNTQFGRTGSSLDGSARGNNPETAAAIEEIFKNTPVEKLPEVRLNFPIPNDRRAAISQLKIGYLAGFMMFGYRYILADRLEIVREQIRNPEKQLIEVESLMLGVTDPPVQNAIIQVRAPAELEAIAVLFTLKKPIHGTAHRSVILPTPSSPSDFFERMVNLRASGISPKITGSYYPITRPPRR